MNATKRAAILLKIGNRLSWSGLIAIAIAYVGTLVLIADSLTTYGFGSEHTGMRFIGIASSGFLVTFGLMCIKASSDDLHNEFKRWCETVPAPKNSVERKLVHALVMRKLCLLAIATAKAKTNYDEFINRQPDNDASPKKIIAGYAEHDELLAMMNTKSDEFERARLLATAFGITAIFQIDDFVGCAQHYGAEATA